MNSNDHVPTHATSEPSATEAPPILELAAAPDAAPPLAKRVRPARSNVPERAARGLWNYVLPLMFLLSLGVLVLYAAPYLLIHWRLMDARAEAEAGYLKRHAELKAEAEHADQRLDLLDKRVNLVSLGFRELARKVSPVVVNVANYRQPTEKELAAANPGVVIFDRENDRNYVQHGVGSGVIIKPGVILTNYHVIKKAERLRVSLPSGRSMGIDLDRVVGDAKTDLAIIRLPDDLPPALKEETQRSAEFADSDKDVHVGDWALAMGSPLGLKHTISHGIISAKGRLLATRAHDDDLMELLQTDAALNPGNSGGPLFDQLGRVVGINVMIASDTGLNQGIGFAIPSNNAKRIANLLLTKGEVPRGFLGIAMDELPGPDAKALKIDDGAVIVKDVVRGQAAAKAGLKPGDIIVRVNKEPIQRYKPIRHFRQIIGDLEPGTEVTLEVVRDDERVQVTLTLGKRPASTP